MEFAQSPKLDPVIYAYSVKNPEYNGLLKIGYTTKDPESRVRQQFPIKNAGCPLYRIECVMAAIRSDGSSFTDKDVHKYLRKKQVENPNRSEWFRCSSDDVKNAIIAVRQNKEIDALRIYDFKMRPEQVSAVHKTKEYYLNWQSNGLQKVPHFLWNAKMRFGKTFACYQLALSMKWKRILILTFKPAVQSAWEEDLQTHIDFEGWQLITKDSNNISAIDKNLPLICFGSFQDFLGRNDLGGIKPKNKWVHEAIWDCVILDEYHYGAWRDSAKDLFSGESSEEVKFIDGPDRDYYDEEKMPIKTKAYLYLSGTPFRAISSGEFLEEEIFNWTYSDEQKAKNEWCGGNNPYAALPKMIMLTYQMPDSIINIASKGEYNQFDLNTFFSAEGEGDDARFVYEEYVQKWLELIRGNYLGDQSEVLRIKNRPPLPFSDPTLLSSLQHTFWFLPNVSSCFAMANLLNKRNNIFYHDYKVIVSAGNKAGIGVKALYPVLEKMENPVRTKTITLSCMKLTTGVSVRPWSGIFMLRDISSPESYFQAAFRVQTPWVIKESDGHADSNDIILKRECYVFDFSPQRALRQISDYSCRLNINETNPERKVGEVIKFLPILAYDGSSMREIDAAGVLDIALSGTTATLLAKRWESPRLVDLSNDILKKLLHNSNAMEALKSIEGFRNVNHDMEIIISKSEHIKKIQKEDLDKERVKKVKKELSDEEKEYRSLRKQIQDKLIKFLTRIPIFMYLTDYRELALEDVIREVEPDLFIRVTGISKSDFNLLVSMGLFNADMLNEAIYGFKRYEDASLSYSGVTRNTGDKVGLWSKVITKDY